MGYSQPLDHLDIEFPELHRMVQEHINKALVSLPEGQHLAILAQYNRLYCDRSEQEANLFILHLREHHQVVVGVPYYYCPAFFRVFSGLLHSDKRGKKLAKRMAMIGGIRGYWCVGLDGGGIKAAAVDNADRCRRFFSGEKDLEFVIDYAEGKGVLTIGGCFADEGAQEKRLVCSEWWERQLMRIRTQGREALAQLLGLTKQHVSKQGDAYQQGKHERSIKMLSDTVAVSPTGKEVSLLEIAMSAVRGRFSRLLCWTDGMGEYAEKYGHECAMYTLTCPSRMHPSSDKYDGTTARESQQYLAGLWNQANARFKKGGFYPYGVRVSEPHKDGAVHWHVLLFAPINVLMSIDGILSDHALRVDGSEAGASKHRYEFKLIEKREGGAKPSTYLFKYILKGLGADARLSHKNIS